LDITNRQQAILEMIIDNFIESQEPVGSKSMHELFNVSSATIRNEMAKLEKMNLLMQPHTSAGRVPTLQGYQYYANNLEIPKVRRIKQDITAGLKQIAEKYNVLTFSSTLSYENKMLTRVLIEPLDHEKALVAFAIDNRECYSQILNLTGLADVEKLNFAQFVKQEFEGEYLGEIYHAMKIKLPMIASKYFSNVQKIFELVEQIFSKLFVTQINVFNTLSLVENAPQELIEKRKFLYENFKNANFIAETLDLGTNKEFEVVIRENDNSLLSGLSIIYLPYKVDENDGKNVIGVIAQTPVNYKEIAVDLQRLTGGRNV
jgi:heat-inducible transcriptional repressor